MALYLLSIMAWSEVILLKVEKSPPCHPVFYELDPWCYTQGKTYIESGSGFIWQGKVWTSHHLVAGAFSLGVMLENRVLEAEIVVRAPRIDYAILKSSLPQKGYTTGLLPSIGDKVTCTGYAYGQTLQKNSGSIVETHATIELFDMDMPPLLKLSCAALPGMSGGSVLNQNGELIAMLIASDQKDTAYALPIRYLLDD